MEKDITPEGKLLRLIKSKKASTEKPIERKKKFIDIKKWIASKKPFLKIAAIKKNITGNLSKTLIFLLLGVIIYFLLDSLVITPYFRYRFNKISLEPFHSEKASDEAVVITEKEPKAEPTKPYSYYSKDITNRNIFKPLVQEEAKAVEDEFKKIRESLNLIGIILGEKLQAAIEDKQSKKTYFVYKGEYIGDVLVEDILEDKAILNYKGEKFELML